MPLPSVLCLEESLEVLLPPLLTQYNIQRGGAGMGTAQIPGGQSTATSCHCSGSDSDRSTRWQSSAQRCGQSSDASNVVTGYVEFG